MNAVAAAIGILTAVATSSAAAQKVYRCGSDGRTTYQQTPCAQGQVIDASDSRSTEQRAAAQTVAKSEAKSAARLDQSLQPASAPKGGKTAHGAAPASADRAASDATTGKKKSAAPEKPLVYLVPAKPGAAGSAAKP